MAAGQRGAAMIAANPAIDGGAVQAAFRALADPTRRDILLLLGAQEMTIAEVSDRFAMTRAAVKKHLTVLEEGRLISVRAQGRERINRLEPEALKPVVEWLVHFERFWDQRLTRLQDAVARETAQTATPKPAKPKSTPRTTRKPKP
ncbi:MAG: ArsR/SmtB family transcription factor [Hyphomicrobiaceae bacterium]